MFWNDFLEFIVIVFGMALLAVLVIGLPAIAIDAHGCHNYQTVTGKTTRYEILAGCYVQTESGWELWSEYKLRAAGSEGLKEAAE